MTTRDLVQPGLIPRGRHLTPAQKRDVLHLRSDGWTIEQIALELTCSTRTVLRVLKATPPETMVAVTGKALAALDVPRAELRDAQKAILITRFREALERTCQWVDELIASKDPRSFNLVLQGLERINALSKDAVGEAAVAPGNGHAPVQVNLKVLLGQILGKEPVIVDARPDD